MQTTASSIDPHQIATAIFGAIDWQDPVTGFCQCPGAAAHTHKTGPRDCRVSLDGAPTAHCFHTSCAPRLAELNKRLRRELSAADWQLTLPGGAILRSGDILQPDGAVLRKNPVSSGSAHVEQRQVEILEKLREAAHNFAPQLFESFDWPFKAILSHSPLKFADRDPEDQFRAWLNLWPSDSTIWIGDVFSSGSPEHRSHFRSPAEWMQIGPAMGNFTCGSSFLPGTFRRSNEHVHGQRFLVVESDVLTRNEVGAVFRYLTARLHYRLHCIIDTAGKSLHGWFDAPPNKLVESRLKAALEVFGCDPKMFTYSQPVRVPGAFRDGRLQRLIWLRE